MKKIFRPLAILSCFLLMLSFILYKAGVLFGDNNTILLAATDSLSANSLSTRKDSVKLRVHDSAWFRAASSKSTVLFDQEKFLQKKSDTLTAVDTFLYKSDTTRK